VRHRTDSSEREGNNRNSCVSTIRHDPILYSLERQNIMYNIIYIVGAIVIVIAILSFFGLR
jgi:hypothetical protein